MNITNFIEFLSLKNSLNILLGLICCSFPKNFKIIFVTVCLPVALTESQALLLMLYIY